MDQDAFRTLLSAPRQGESSTSKRTLGGPQPKRGWNIKAKPGHEYKPKIAEEGDKPAFTPRQHVKKQNEGKYMDRAEMRRKGLDDEYKPVERMLEDFEKRQKEAGEDEEKIERNRAMLGGDATHSILVKGLDYALLAARKAELAREGEQVADEELDAIVKERRDGKKAKTQEKEVAKKEIKEDLGRGFKSISAKDAPEGEKKKKKKKKKVKVEEGVAQSGYRDDKVKAEEHTSQKVEEDALPSTTLPNAKPEIPIASSSKLPTPPIEEDEDIFGDAGEYDLNQGRPEDEDDTEEEEEGDGRAHRGRSRTRSRSIDRRRSRSRSRGRGRSYSRSYSYSPRRGRPRSFSYSRSPPRRGYRDRSYSYSPSRTRSRSPEYASRTSVSRRYDRYAPRREETQRNRYSRSPVSRRSPRYHSKRSPSPYSPAPPVVKRKRSPTRSPSPIHYHYNLPPTSRSPSPSSSISSSPQAPGGVRGKLQPLQSSTIADLRGFLDADASAAKDEERRIRKAKWRAKQGLGVQEGAPDLSSGAGGEGEKGEKAKRNREFQMVMNRVERGKGDGGQ